MFHRTVAFAGCLLVASAVHARDVCERWEQPAHPVITETCSYPDGKSGYYRITNKGTTAATVCWRIEFRNGKGTNGCHSGLAAGEESSGSCFSCGLRNDGVQGVTIRKYDPR